MAWCLTREYQEESTNTPRGETYCSAKEATTVGKGHIDRHRLAVAFPPGSVFDGCKEWVKPGCPFIKTV